jgi:hypothetical protein
MYVEVNTNFPDPGVTIDDNYWTNIQADINTNLDITELGVYTVTYCATDGSGNGPVCVDRIVTVGDTTAPALSLIGMDTTIVEVNTHFTDPGIEAIDNYWPLESLTVDTGGTFSLPANELGLYNRTYTVTDGSGNTSVIERFFLVVDTTPPVIVLNDSKCYTCDAME